MQRTLMTTIMIHVIALLAGVFIFLDLSVDAISAIINSSDFAGELTTLGGQMFEAMLKPYNALENSVFTPIAVLIITGFIAGLIAKDGTRIIIAIMALILTLFLGYAVLNGIPLEATFLKELASGMAGNLALSFFVLFMSGIAGAAFTAETY